MELKNIIENTRTVHSYKYENIQEDIIKEALELSLNAPNHRLTFPWEIYWPRLSKREELLALFKSLSSAEDFARKNYDQISEFIFFSQKLADSEFTRKEDYATISCSIHLFAMALAEKGIGYKWSTGAFSRAKEIYDFLGLDSSCEEIVGMIYVGTSSKPIAPRKRPTLDEVLSII